MIYSCTTLVCALVFRWWCFLKSAECKLLQLSTRLTTCFWDKLFKSEKIIRSQYCKYPQFTLIWPVPYWVQQLSPWRSSCSKVTNTRKIESMKVKTVLIWMSLLPVSVWYLAYIYIYFYIFYIKKNGTRIQSGHCPAAWPYYCLLIIYRKR